MVASIIVGVLIDKRINKHLKGFVENFAGAVNDEDKKIADTLYKKWKKHYLRSIKIILNEFREETYPFGNKILEDLRSVKKGLKVEMSSFYTQLSKGNDGEAANRLLLEIVKLIEKNSYTI
ncbi:hypothetical protein FACS1894211_11380 [Clostridia bacterium]|nr:hypothetical protein FACS1894211_11380 [Clostridia bacterium]